MRAQRGNKVVRLSQIALRLRSGQASSPRRSRQASGMAASATLLAMTIDTKKAPQRCWVFLVP